jgi:hypothetical protein
MKALGAISSRYEKSMEWTQYGAQGLEAIDPRIQGQSSQAQKGWTGNKETNAATKGAYMEGPTAHTPPVTSELRGLKTSSVEGGSLPQETDPINKWEKRFLAEVLGPPARNR